jgi:polar amino acid transport system substrate-binding protein
MPGMRAHNQCAIIFMLIAIIFTSSIVMAPAAPLNDIPRFITSKPLIGGVKKPDSIRFITSDDFPPFNFVDGTGRLTGYNVELARAICSRMNIRCTIQLRPFNALLDTVMKNRADAIIAGIRDTPALRDFLGYTQPYLRLPGRFVMKRHRMLEATPEDLNGRTVAVARGSRYLAYLRDFFPDSKRLETGSDGESFAAVKAGQADAAFGSALSASFWIAGPDAADCCSFAGGAFSEPAYFGRGLTIAVARDNELLRLALEDALRGLEADGVIAELYTRFFPASLY